MQATHRPRIWMLWALGCAGVAPAARLGGEDCNGNGIPDAMDIAPGFSLGLLEVLGVGQEPQAVTAADLDGDGDLDLATADAASSTITVLDNRGGRTLEKQGSYPAAVLPVGVVAADMNADGAADLVSASSRLQEIVVLVRNAQGLYEPGGAFPIGAEPRSIAAVDLDGDAASEVAVAAPFALIILANDGAGRLALRESITIGSNPAHVLALDVDGDADVDLATANSLERNPSRDNVSVFENRGDGSLAPGRNYAAGRSPTAFSALDLDGDGDLDLATASAGQGEILILHNDGRGEFRPGTGFELGAGIHAMTAADLNGDGRGDVAAIREGGGSPGLFPLLFILINRGGDEFSFSTRSLLNERAWGPLVAADLDADAHPDLACVSEELSYVALLWNSGQGRFEGFLPPPPRPGTFSALGPLLLADLDRDAHLDLLAQGQSPPSLVLLPGRGDGAFGESRAVPFLRTPADLAAADVDGDDDLDLVTAEVSDGAALYINSGEGCFGIPRRLASGGFIRKVSPADLDGDNRLDLAFLNGQPLHRLSVTWNEGGDAWSDVLLIATVGCADLVAAGDFDGNGRSDLAVASCSPRGIFLHSSREGRSFGEGVGLELGQGTVHALAARDLDRDGRLDLAASFTTTSSSGILVYWNEGNGTFAPPVEHSSPAPAERLVFVDLEGDGDTDLAAFARGIVTFFRRREGRTFDRWGASLALSASDTPVAGDLNEDGLVDFVVPVELNRGIAVLLGGRTDPESRDDDGDGLPDECEATRFHRGDANADGSLDITDPVFLLSYLFLAGVQPACLEAADADDDGRLDLTDGVWLLNYLFLEGPPPPAPGPPGSSPCGPDPDAADPPGALGCDAYSGC